MTSIYPNTPKYHITLNPSSYPSVTTSSGSSEYAISTNPPTYSPMENIPEYQSQEFHPITCSREIAWPALIYLIIGIIMLIYIMAASGVSAERRISSIIIIVIWVAIWYLFLWWLWHACHREIAWILLFLVTFLAVIYLIFFITLTFEQKSRNT